MFAHGNRLTRPKTIGSVRRIRRLGILLALLLAAPADAAVVARDGDSTLRAERKGGRICLRVHDSRSSGCQAVPLSPFQPTFAFAFDARGENLRTVAAAVVPAAVEAKLDDGRRVPTIAAEGFRERFLIVDGVDPAGLLRFYDAQGNLIGAARNEFARFDRLGAGQMLLRRAGVRIRAERDFQLLPDPLRLDRTIPATCLEISQGNGSAGSCRPDGRAPTLELTVDSRCAPRRSVISGPVDPRVQAVELTLGSGRTMRLPTVAPEPPFGGLLRLLAARLPAGEAVRSARGLDGNGRTRGFSILRAAPGGLRCPGGGGSFGQASLGFIDDHPRARTTGVVVAQAASQELFAGDSRDRGSICVAFARPRTGCAQAPVDSSFFLLERSGAAVGGVVAADVATVALTVDGGDPITVPTTDGSSYAGRFAGRVRFVTADVPPGARITKVVAQHADGRRLGRGFVYARQRDGVVERIAPGLVVRDLGFGFASGSGRGGPFCVAPREARGLAAFGACKAGPEGGATASASCAPQRLQLYGYLPPGVRGVSVALAGGRRVAAEVVRLGPRAGGGRVWHSTAPRALGVRAVVFSERPPRPFRRAPIPDRRQPLRLPPVTEQCGYDASTEFF